MGRGGIGGGGTQRAEGGRVKAIIITKITLLWLQYMGHKPMQLTRQAKTAIRSSLVSDASLLCPSGEAQALKCILVILPFILNIKKISGLVPKRTDFPNLVIYVHMAMIS